MIKESNKFGAGILLDAEDLIGPIYATCTACMGIYSEFLSWANTNVERITTYAEEATNIIILSCQVTDLAVLNDLRHLEKLMIDFPNKKFYIGGCLSKRFDIELPKGVKRLNNIDSDHTLIENFNLVNYEKPFWVKDFQDSKDTLSKGNLFRNMYPVRIGVGCKSKCTYCTIRITRGKYKRIKPNFDEIININKDIVLIADSPTVKDIKEWKMIAILGEKPISIRNIEPKVVKKVAMDLLDLAQKGLLNIFHSPIQHTNRFAIEAMGRSYQDVEFVLGFCRVLRSLGVKTATNIIIDYLNYPDPVNLKNEFDYVSWNPYWDGVWDREKAEERFYKYLD